MSARPFYTYSASDGHKTLGNLGDVAALIEINGLEHIDLGHAPRLTRLLETVDIFHLLELSAGCVDLGDTARHQFVHKAVEKIVKIKKNRNYTDACNISLLFNAIRS